MGVQFLRYPEVAERYGVSPFTIRNWLSSDPTFPKPVRLSPGCVRWRISNLEAWEAAKAEHQSPPDAAGAPQARVNANRIASEARR